MTQSLEDFQTLGLCYFQRWISAGYDITIGHGDGGHYIEIAAQNVMIEISEATPGVCQGRRLA
jgi:hypothetical protein